MLVRNGGFFPRFRISKTLFSNPFFFKKESKEGKPRIEFSPANKKKKRMCSYARIEFSCVFLRTKNNRKKTVFTTSLTKKGDFAYKKQFLQLH